MNPCKTANGRLRGSAGELVRVKALSAGGGAHCRCKRDSASEEKKRGSCEETGKVSCVTQCKQCEISGSGTSQYGSRLFQ